jgi:hypothetical protein
MVENRDAAGDRVPFPTEELEAFVMFEDQDNLTWTRTNVGGLKRVSLPPPPPGRIRRWWLALYGPAPSDPRDGVVDPTGHTQGTDSA